MVLIKSPPIPTWVYALCFHIANYIYASEAGAVFMHSRNLDEIAKTLFGQWQGRRWTAEAKAEQDPDNKTISKAWMALEGRGLFIFSQITHYSVSSRQYSFWVKSTYTY